MNFESFWPCQGELVSRRRCSVLQSLVWTCLNMERTPIAIAIALVVYLMVSKDPLLLWAWGSIAVIPSMTAVWIAGLKREGWMRNTESRERLEAPLEITLQSSSRGDAQPASDALATLLATSHLAIWAPTGGTTRKCGTANGVKSKSPEVFKSWRIDQFLWSCVRRKPNWQIPHQMSLILMILLVTTNYYLTWPCFVRKCHANVNVYHTESYLIYGVGRVKPIQLEIG